MKREVSASSDGFLPGIVEHVPALLPLIGADAEGRAMPSRSSGRAPAQ